MRRAFVFVHALLLAVSVFVISFASSSARADASLEGKVRIQDVVSPGGIEAWLVESHSVPVLAVEVGFEGGSRFDPEDRPGMAGFMAGLLDEGAGNMDAQAFKAALQDKAIRIGFDVDRDTVFASLRTLSPYTDEAFRLFSLALTKPRFDRRAIERVRNQILVSLARQESDPGTVASKAWFRGALAGQPYAWPVYGTAQSIKSITRARLMANFRAHIGRKRMKVAVVGPIDAARLGELLDKTFGGLPALAQAEEPAPLSVTGRSEPTVITRDIPQSVVVFGGPGLKPTNKDFLAGYVMNYILGGGSFASRLMDEIREKRGLTYGISTGLAAYRAGGILIGSFSCRNDAYPEAYRVLIDEINRMVEGGVTDKELADAKKYLTGSYALRFDSNDKIAPQILTYQLVGYDVDYFNRRNALINAVTKEDVARVAAKLLKPDAMTFVVVGQPGKEKAAAGDKPRG